MTLINDPEVLELTSVLRQLVADVAPLDRSATLAAEGAMDADLWRVLGRDIGVLALAIPEELGGSGRGVQELGVVAGALGSVLAPVPFIVSSACGATLLAGIRGPVADGLMRTMVDEDAITTVDTRSALLDSVEGLSATKVDGQWLLTGMTPPIEFAGQAHFVLLPQRGMHGLSIFAVEVSSPGVKVVVEPTLDPSVPMGRLALSSTPAQLLVEGSHAENCWNKALSVGRVCLVNELASIIAWALDCAVEHAKSRRQFGAPIGSFQAVQFMCADMYLALDRTEAAAAFVTWAADNAPEELASALPVAAMTCSEAARDAAGVAIQVLGGMGFTWEHDLHRFFKRAQSSMYRMGSPAGYRAQLTEQWGLLS